LAGTSTGALMVISKSSELKFYAESGDIIDAVVSKRLLISIFNKYSPLHDGGVIIYNGRVKAARCILPVTERDIPAQFGLRHRAAIGMSEATDTLVLIVSEETGQVSLAKNGKILHNLSSQEVREILNDYLSGVDVDEKFESLSLYERKKAKRAKEVE
jgi:diadenylate cyclase